MQNKQNTLINEYIYKSFTDLIANLQCRERNASHFPMYTLQIELNLLERKATKTSGDNITDEIESTYDKSKQEAILTNLLSTLLSSRKMTIMELQQNEFITLVKSEFSRSYANKEFS